MKKMLFLALALVILTQAGFAKGEKEGRDRESATKSAKSSSSSLQELNTAYQFDNAVSAEANYRKLALDAAEKARKKELEAQALKGAAAAANLRKAAIKAQDAITVAHVGYQLAVEKNVQPLAEAIADWESLARSTRELQELEKQIKESEAKQKTVKLEQEKLEAERKMWELEQEKWKREKDRLSKLPMNKDLH